MCYLALSASVKCLCYGLQMFYSFSAGIDFRGQILTSKVGPRAERLTLQGPRYLLSFLFTLSYYCTINLVSIFMFAPMY